MKKTFFLSLTFAAFAISAAAETTTPVSSNDTIVDVSHARKVLLTETDSLLRLSIRGSENDSTYTFDYTKELSPDNSSLLVERGNKWDFGFALGDGTNLGKGNQSEGSRRYLSMGGLGFGFVTAVGAPKGMDVDMSASYEIFAEILGVNYKSYNRKNTFHVGFGLNWRNWRMTGRSRFVQDGSDILLSDYPEGATIDYSRIKVFSLIVPFTYVRHFKKVFRFDASAILHFNTYGSIETKYALNGEKRRDFTKNVHQRPVTVSLQAALGYRWFGYYVKYNPCNVLHKDFAPNFQTISTGFTILY